MYLSSFTDVERAYRRDRDFVNNRTHEITESCLLALEQKKRVFINYFAGTINKKEYFMVEILEEGVTIFTSRFRFDKTQTVAEFDAQQLLENCSRWNGVSQQKLQDLILKNNPW